MILWCYDWSLLAQLAQVLQRCGCEGAVPFDCTHRAVCGLVFLKAAGVGHSSFWCHSREQLGAVKLVLTCSRKQSCLLLEFLIHIQLKTRVALLFLVAFAILKHFACISVFLLCPPHNVCALSGPFSLLWHSYAQRCIALRPSVRAQLALSLISAWDQASLASFVLLSVEEYELAWELICKFCRKIIQFNAMPS